MKAVFHGNYVTVFLDDLAKYEALKMFSNKYFAYELKKWNPDIKAYEYIMIRRYWFNPSRLSFTTFRGLTVRVKRIAENLKMGRVEAKYRELDYDLYEAKFLRKYQLEALISILKQLEFQGAATLQACTGNLPRGESLPINTPGQARSGKTEVAVALHKVLKPRKTFFLSLNTDLLIQAKQRFKKYGEEAGLVNKDYFQIDRNVVCCTVQTLYRAIRTYEAYEYPEESLDEEVRHLLEETDVEDKLKLYETYRKADLVIMDECQHVPARTVWYTSMANPNALRLALSATPWRDDGREESGT
ncbi:hypothetical protein DRO69_06215 [Candidatus Bathyarchaeota archaeon]|nr:MAG: hypothetical protein DRO69_06215 [Candidatus Bathyarchaeota archaeon]